MHVRVVLIAAAITALGAPAAGAQQPSPAPEPPAVPAPPPEPPSGTLTLRADADTVLVRAPLKVHGTLRPYVAGQEVVVRFTRGERALRAVRVPVRRDGAVGRFSIAYTPRRTGRVVVRAVHRQTTELDTVRARGVGVDVVARRVGPGSPRAAVVLLQRRLDRLGYVVGRRGVYDARTARAVLALRKVAGLPRTTVADPAVFAALASGAGRFRVRFPEHGRHVEADISRQVLALIGADGRVQRIYPTSSGAPATPTILGSFRVYRKDRGTNARGMVHSSYFIRGYAIHGYREVPVYNASHGCLRVPVPDALSIFRWVRLGTRVDTYR